MTTATFFGIWGKLREEFIKTHKPKHYRLFKQNSDIFFKYLNHFQRGYSIRAAVLAQKLEAEENINENLFDTNKSAWIVASSKIEDVVGLTIKTEIQW